MWSCREQFESGLLHFVSRIRDRRYVAVDEERGIVVAFGFFDHDAGKNRHFTTPDGRSIVGGPQEPYTWEIAEAFKVEKGLLHEVEAVLTGGALWHGLGVEQPRRRDVGLDSVRTLSAKARRRSTRHTRGTKTGLVPYSRKHLLEHLADGFSRFFVRRGAAGEVGEPLGDAERRGLHDAAAARTGSVIMPAPQVKCVAGSTRMKLPVPRFSE